MRFRSFRQALLGGAALAAAFAMAAPASAGVVVDFGFGTTGLNSLSYTPDGPIGAAGSVSGLSTIKGYSLSTIGADDTTTIGGGTQIITMNWNDPISFVSGTQTLPSSVTETFTSAIGTYSAVFTSLFAQPPSNATGLDWVLEGTLTNPDLTTQQVFLSAAFTNVTNSNVAATSVSFTETSNPPPVIETPEPASMAVLGMGLMGLGAARRRKS